MGTRFLIVLRWVIFFGLVVLAARAFSAERLTVSLQSGRTFTGAVDARTDEQRLWLRFGEGTTVVLRSLAWESVAAAKRNGQPISLERLRPAAEEMKSAATSDDAAPSAEPSAPNADEIVTPLPQVAYLPPPPRVSTVAFDAILANWDADAPPDGLAVYVRPLDAWGGLVAVHGIVHVELTGRVRRDFSAVPHGRGMIEESLGRWTVNLASALPTTDGYLIKLPFAWGALPPEEVYSRGRVHLRLAAPGNGVFEAVTEAVQILPYAAR
jgi:hypothetical protein